MVPTIHYQMGGIPTNIHGQVVAPKDGNPNAVVNGLYAVGECACVACTAPTAWAPTRCSTCWCSAARPATTSSSTQLQAAGRTSRCRTDAADCTLARLARLDGATGGEYAQDVANDIRATMQPHCGVFRTQDAAWTKACARSWSSRERVQAHRIKDKSQGVQHRAHRGAGARQPDRDGAGDDRLGRGAQGKPRRAHATTTRPPTIPNGARRELDEAHAVVHAKATASTTSR